MIVACYLIGSNDDGFAVEVKLKFCAQTDDDLTIRPGDIITHVLQREDGWWEGNLGNSRGRFPSNFVKVSSIKKDFQEQ